MSAGPKPESAGVRLTRPEYITTPEEQEFARLSADEIERRNFTARGELVYDQLLCAVNCPARLKSDFDRLRQDNPSLLPEIMQRISQAYFHGRVGRAEYRNLCVAAVDVRLVSGTAELDKIRARKVLMVANHYVLGKDLHIPTALLRDGVKGAPNERSELYYHSHAPFHFGLHQALNYSGFKALGWDAGFTEAARDGGILYLHPQRRVESIRALAREDESLLSFPEGKTMFGVDPDFGIRASFFTLARLIQAQAIVSLAFPDYLSTSKANPVAVGGVLELDDCDGRFSTRTWQGREKIRESVCRMLVHAKLDLEK